MTLQNRVAPSGELVAVDARGTLMGNRGLLHDAHRNVVRDAAVDRWIICVLDFKGRRRTVMTPGRYTELFFLDEPTALAAGHRPCFDCRRPAAQAFATLAGASSAIDLDRMLSPYRRPVGPSRPTWSARAGELPDGAMFRRDGGFWLVVGAKVRPWSFTGYGAAQPLPTGQVDVLTPEPSVRALRAGYGLHPS